MKKAIRIAHILTMILLLSYPTYAKNKMKKATTSSPTKAELSTILDGLKKEYTAIRPKVIQKGEGYLKYPYLIPAGFYKQMWDWDGFFMANHFISIGKPEYMKYWALNLLEGVNEKGYVSGCATTKGPRPIFGDFAMKPFLSQGVYLYAKDQNDHAWVKQNYEKLKLVIEYREQTQKDEKTGLFYWDNAMQSGADNNPAMNYFTDDKRSFLSCDASTWQLREYEAQASIARLLGKKSEEKIYKSKATELRNKINEILWCEKDEVFYNVDRETGDFYKRVSYSSFVPLLDGVAPEKNAKAMIERYLINNNEMKANYGFRSLSAQDPDYNNKNIIIPFSNWQGPVWPIVNYIYSIGLKRYGYDNELKWLGATLGDLLTKDIQKWGSMHETYHAETGAPLAPSHDHIDENGKIVGFISWNLCIQNVLEGVVNDKWMMLDVQN